MRMIHLQILKLNPMAINETNSGQMLMVILLIHLTVRKFTAATESAMDAAHNTRMASSK